MDKLKLLAAAVLVGLALAPAAGFAQTPATTGEIVPATPLPELARNQTVVLGWGVAGGSSVGNTNPWALPGYTHQEGNNLMWEPLMYFAIFKNDYIPWLAELDGVHRQGLHQA